MLLNFGISILIAAYRDIV